MEILYSLVNGRIVRACRANDPTFAGFGDTNEEALAKLEEREQTRDLEIRALHVMIRSFLCPHVDALIN